MKLSERFNVDVDEVLGANYLVTSISCNSYNPMIDSKIHCPKKHLRYSWF